VIGLAKRYLFDALVAGLAVVAQIEIWLRDDTPGWEYVGALTVATLALFLRHLSPFAAPFIAFAAAVSTSVADRDAAYDSVTVFFVVVLAMWAAGQLERTREALIGYATGITGTIFVVSRFPDDGPSDFFWITAFLTGAWLASYVAAQRGRHARELVERAERLESERETLIGDERRRIARELHDVVAHSVSVMTVQAGGVRRLLREDQEREREALLAIENTGREALREMRRLLGMLRESDESPSLAPQPGIDGIDALVEQMREAGLPVSYHVTGEPVQLPPGIDVSAYRIVQEALTNALKHAGHARAEVTVRYAGDRLELEVVNDGAADPNGAAAGHGLVGMQERVALYGGELEAGPRREGGYSVRAQLPVKELQP
jgi:signal transduction histidine kinase